MAQCQGPRAQIVRLFFSLHLYLAKKFCKNLQVPETSRNVNPARSKTTTIHLHLACFYGKKYLKKRAVGNTIIEQIIEFELRGPGPPDRICTSTTR